MGMKIDGISTSEHVDSSGEVLRVDKHDISDLVEGKGVLNWEHDETKNPDNILGKITFAKKIMSPQDATTDRERLYWNACKTPFVYIQAELYDGEDHPGAVAAAALIRYYARRGEKILAGFSVEGQTLERDDNELKQSVARRVALTLRPCNKSCISGLLEDPQTRQIIEKSEGRSNGSHLFEMDSIIVSDAEPLSPAEDLAKCVQELRKTLTAGNYNVAPSTLVGGAALQREEIIGRNQARVKAAYRDWPRARPLREWLKAELPDISSEYLDHFSDVAHEVSLKKGEPQMLRIGTNHSPNMAASDDQKNLIDGLYLANAKQLSQNLRSPTRVANDRRQNVVIKTPGRGMNMRDAAHNATAYHAAAHAMGMGDHVPVTNYFLHPSTPADNQNGPRYHQAQEFLKGHKTLMETPIAEEAINEARVSGDAHKLAILDHVLGAESDRHFGNIMIGGGKMKHIDNDDAFAYDHPLRFSDYDKAIQHDTMPVQAVQWLNSVDPNRLAYVMRQNGLGHSDVSHAMSRLQAAREKAAHGYTMGQILGIPSKEAP